METVIGIFNERGFARALSDLYAHGFTKDEISVVDRNAITHGPEVPLAGGTGPGAGTIVAAGQANTISLGSGTPGMLPVLAWEWGGTDFLSLNIPQEAEEFYRHALDNGSTLIVARTTEQRANIARNIMKKANAQNVTEPPPDRSARV
jgi:hypothetical protein